MQPENVCLLHCSAEPFILLCGGVHQSAGRKRQCAKACKRLRAIYLWRNTGGRGMYIMMHWCLWFTASQLASENGRGVGVDGGHWNSSCVVFNTCVHHLTPEWLTMSQWTSSCHHCDISHSQNVLLLTLSQGHGTCCHVSLCLSSFSCSALLIRTSQWRDTTSTSPWSPRSTSIQTSPSETIKVGVIIIHMPVRPHMGAYSLPTCGDRV